MLFTGAALAAFLSACKFFRRRPVTLVFEHSKMKWDAMSAPATSIAACFISGCFAFCMASHAIGQSPSAEKAASSDRLPSKPLREDILTKAADETALVSFGEYVRKQFADARQIDPTQARRVVMHALYIVDRLDPASDDARKRLEELKEEVAFYKRLVDAGDVKIETLGQRLLADPNDFENFLLYEIKFQVNDDALYEKEPFDSALKRLEKVAGLLEATRSKTTDRRIADECAILIERIDKVHKARLERAQARLSLIGTPATFPSATSGVWLNGDPLSADDFKGKVVLIDFWALWCGLCITGFPKVDQWHEKYSEQGLVVVAAARQEDDDPGEKTQAQRINTLFRQKEIGFRSLIDDGGLFEAHRVESVPHYCLIDRTGRIRMVRTGNNPASRIDMESEIKNLLMERPR